MKNLRSELTAEGRTDILKRVMAYRGGEKTLTRVHGLRDLSFKSKGIRST